MDKIKLTLELTPEQLSKLMLDIRTGADVPASHVATNNNYYEEKLAEAEEIIRQKDSRIAGMEEQIKDLSAVRDDRDMRLADLARELDHLRNVCAAPPCGCGRQDHDD